MIYFVVPICKGVPLSKPKLQTLKWSCTYRLYAYRTVTSHWWSAITDLKYSTSMLLTISCSSHVHLAARHWTRTNGR